MRQYNCTITFFNKKKVLGTFPLIDMSQEYDRMIVAYQQGIKEFDSYNIDNGRIRVLVNKKHESRTVIISGKEEKYYPEISIDLAYKILRCKIIQLPKRGPFKDQSKRLIKISKK